MNCHQVLSGACNSGDQCFAVGSVEGIPFTAYAAGCNIVILASNFERVQIIPGAIHGYVRIGSLDCSTDTGKIAAAYGAEVCIFEPTPLIHSAATTHGLEYRWVQTGKLVADGPITALSWNLEGTRLLTGGKILQLWHQASLYQDDSQPSSGVTFQIGGSDKDDKPKQQEEDEPGWLCVWQCHTATPTHHLAFSPDGVLFATSGVNDRLVKIWYQNKVLANTHAEHAAPELNYTFIYVAHPRAVTHLSWRKTSKYMPKGSVGNVLVTSCVDNICRVWAETLLPEDEWGGGCVTSHSRSPPRRQRATHRHKHRFMQRLKHMKTCFHIRRHAHASKQPGAPLPTLPSTYSAHDFHSPYHTTSYTGGLHFHLAASINAETDIPLVPSLSGGGRFILHWLHNKEMHFTSQAEAILHDLTKKILDKEENEEAGSGSDHTNHVDGENETKHNNRRASHHMVKTQSEDNSNSDEHQPGSGNHSHPSLSNTTSINSIATDVTCTHLPDSLDAKIEALLRDWHQSPDLLFSIHPVDGSFLIWVCEWLDELQAGAIRQAQVSFSARIPCAFPLGDATTMCTPAALYHAAAQPLYVRHRTKPVVPGPLQQPETVTTPLASVQEEKEDNEWPQPDGENDEEQETGAGEENNNGLPRKQSLAAENQDESQDGDVLDSAPVISMVTNHTNGTLNLWQLTFDDKSKFSQVLSIGHASRASGHRFRVNDITCHPVLPLLLTTSHHNISDSDRDVNKPEDGGAAGGLCSELIMWRVECVGPLGKSGGVSELARVNSPHLSAFSNVAWLPTLLPSTTLGNLSNSPSACFVASDGESLRVFQAVIDARTVLAEIATSERRHNNVMDEMSMSSDSTLEEGGGVPLHDRITIVSQQSTARPGAIIQLHAIADATHDWHNTQLLHVFQEQLITGERTSVDTDSADSGVEGSEVNTITEAGLEAIVDLRKAAVFNEPFYIVVLERTDGGSTVHMWRLTVSSQADPNDELTSSMMYVPDSALIQEDDGVESRKNSVSMADDRPLPNNAVDPHLSITTKKVCECPLALPDGVDVIHATPAAGHLSSASIYPACLAPYILATACSDSTLRFWKCNVSKKDDGEYDYAWKEWEMMNKDHESAIDIPGQPLHISAAYSGRIACAYKCGRSFTRPKGGGTTGTNNAPSNTDARFVNLCVCVYECESTGGAEWLLEDTIPLRNVSLPRVGVCADTQIDLSYLHDTSFMQKRHRLTQVLQTLSHEETRSMRNGEADTGKSAGLLAVPSFSTLQSLRKSIMENGNTCPLTQKHLVQLDWVSKEDGSHILTVAVGSRVLLFTPVSSDLAQANLKAMKESINNNRPILRKASSLAAPLFVEEIRWMQLRRIDLKTADGLPPLPMQISWVRDGILVVGMDSEMHVYSQWKPENPQITNGFGSGQEIEEGSESRALRDSDLRISAPHLQRVSSINLQLLERDARRRKAQPDQPQPLLDYMPDYGLFEASQMACPVLPQYHPKQLMELLNSGKIRWVKAILAHLVRCIGGTYAVRGSQGDEDSLSRQRGWSRSRTLSVSFAAGAGSPLDGQGQITEDVQLDYAEITSVPPLPLWTLLVADKESPHHPSTAQEAKDYNELFEGTMDTDEDLDALLLAEEDGVDRRPSMPERQPLSHFGPRQGRILSRLLTHTHLPGLSSLDQMHLLALADTVSTCDADFAERFANNVRQDAALNAGQEITPDSLDDCGLRFLLAMKHYGYLLRCLPITQRATQQRVGVGTCNVVWAFHSETHEQLLQLIPGYAKGQPKWATLRELGVGWWLRGRDLLRICVEKLARAAYKLHNDPMDAALYYLAMKKKALLWGLFRSHHDEKMTSFFANNFGEERWRKAALKNAFALLGKQRFEHAAAFFLLGGALKDALEVLITRLGDLQLAIVVSRLYEPDNALPDSLRRVLRDEILGGETEDGSIDLERAHPDPFSRSMALWDLKQYGDALDTLLSPAGRLHAARDSEPMPSVFNFYVYLRTHPRLKRNNLPTQGGTVALLQQQETEEGITRLERRLYFQTAHGHFKAGCPALALEVLSKLPARVRDEKPRQAASEAVSHGGIVSGHLDVAEPVKTSEPVKAESVDWGAPSVDWSAPVSKPKEDEFVLTWDDDKGSDSGASTPPLEMKASKTEAETPAPDEPKSDTDDTPSVDIMAQQLKFVACLKILMEELSTLATGFEVDGGHLRYQLYIWLEREVEALRRLCGYASAAGAQGGGELICADAEPPPLPDRPTLHQLLLREKADFEAKVQRAVRRKKWLKANETLLRTLLSYCSLQGAGGGGLASVRMELILLLQELGQDKQHQQLLSPLPFPTTLPLLAAAVAANNAVVADPCRHLQSVAADMLATIGEMGIPGGSATRLLHTLRELAVALSACIYQSLCDSDSFSLKHAPHHDISIIAETPGSTHHITRQRRQSTEDLAVTTLPNKWPGVSALRGLALRAAEEEDSPRLPVLLVESFCAVYLALLGWALAARDAHLLYRLAAHTMDSKSHARLFGGGVRRLLTTAPAPPQPKLVERTEGTSVWSSLREKRALLNMKLLGLAPTTPHKNIQEGRPTYREQFVPPYCNILTFLLTKPTSEQDPENYDYDSAESGCEDAEDEGEEDEDDDDIFDTNHTTRNEKRQMRANTEHCDPDSYSWHLMRVAVLRLAQYKLQHFLQTCGIEMQELATTSPMVHGALRRVEQWQQQLTETLESRGAPPDYIPGCFPEQTIPGPPINKYRCLLEKHNTPFNMSLYSAAPARRLWSFLVRQEQVQDVFIRAVFSRRRTASLSGGGAGAGDNAAPGCIPHGRARDDDLHSPVRIIHKEQDSIAAFCLNRVGGGLLAVATAREVQEMDVSLLLRGGACWAEDECEVDLLALSADPAALPDTGFLLIQHQDKPNNGSVPGTGNSSPLNPNAPAVPVGMASQTGRGASVVKGLQFPGCHDAKYCRLILHRSKLLMRPVLKHKIDNIKRMAAHPSLPLYLTGGADGSVQLWEWGHPSCVWSPRAPGAFAKVTRVRFSDYGNKFAVGDADGNLALWQLHPPQQQSAGQTQAAARPFFTHQCHSKGISDFVFLGSCSLVATAGHSSESKNVAIWDTLMPIKKALVISFTCHEGGAACVTWAGSCGALISCGRRGDVCVWDVRTRAAKHKIQAHPAPIKCIALAPHEDKYAIGAADGDIKVFSMGSHQMLHTFAGEHARSSFFKHIGQGVTQIHIDNAGRLFSCGADGTMKVRKLPERDAPTLHQPHY